MNVRMDRKRAAVVVTAVLAGFAVAGGVPLAHAEGTATEGHPADAGAQAATVDEEGSLHLPARTIPVPATISPEAQRALAASLEVELRVDVEADVGDVWADRDRLLQVFENLLGNALKFTSKGGAITVRAARGRGEVSFSVGDRGRGIPSDELPHVFDRFWQSKRTGRGGAGLGLSIVKGVIEAHRGRIWVESKPGVGTTFHFTLPAG